MSDLAFMTVAEAAKRLRGRELSPVEYAKALIARIEQYATKLGAGASEGSWSRSASSTTRSSTITMSTVSRLSGL